MKNRQILIWPETIFTPPLQPALTKKSNHMDLKQIQDLVKMVNKSNISELSIEEKDIKITIKQKEDKYVTAADVAVVDTTGAANASADNRTSISVVAG